MLGQGIDSATGSGVQFFLCNCTVSFHEFDADR